MSDLNSNHTSNSTNSNHTSNHMNNSENSMYNKYFFKENGIIKCIFDNNIYDADLKFISIN